MKADIELVRLVKSGDTQAFSELVRRHQKSLLRLCMKMFRDLDLAEDIVQESFIKSYEKIHLFEGRSSFKSWLFQIAVNTGKNRLRSMKRETVDLEKVSLSIDAEAEQDLAHQDIKKVLIEEVERLPERQRVALTLRVYEDLSFKEIAQIMNCPYDTAKANYRHGLMKIRDVFKENESMRTVFEDWDESRVPINRSNEVKT
ncbi:MAG: sigma-70 family RNA polymerase sigma factor [Bdellovibrionales bacterium]|nr:sigma-70 family RNA polymerase sigma factor [Bdellovibrionales bacterium]